MIGIVKNYTTVGSSYSSVPSSFTSGGVDTSHFGYSFQNLLNPNYNNNISKSSYSINHTNNLNGIENYKSFEQNIIDPSLTIDKYTRTLIIFTASSDGSMQGLYQSYIWQRKYDELKFNNDARMNDYKGKNFVRFTKFENKYTQLYGAQVEGKPVDGDFIVHGYSKEVIADDFPNEGVISVLVSTDDIGKNISKNGIKSLIKWVMDKNHVGRIRIIGHGSRGGTLSISRFDNKPTKFVYYSEIADWLISNGLNDIKYSYNSKGRLAKNGLRTIALGSCVSGSYDNNSGILKENKYYKHKESNTFAYNLQPDFGEGYKDYTDKYLKSMLSEEGLHSFYIHPGDPRLNQSGIGQMLKVFRDNSIYGIQITGAGEPLIVSDDGRQYLEIAQNSPEEIYITSLFKRDYEEYAEDVKLKKYYIKDKIWNLNKRQYFFKKLSEKSIEIFKIDEKENKKIFISNEEHNFVKSKIPLGKQSGIINILPTKYRLMFVLDPKSGERKIVITELYTHSASKMRVIS